MRSGKRILALILTMALALAMAFQVTACAAQTAPAFTDVPADADYAPAVAWCREEGLMNGTSAARFPPTTP